MGKELIIIGSGEDARIAALAVLLVTSGHADKVTIRDAKDSGLHNAMGFENVVMIDAPTLPYIKLPEIEPLQVHDEKHFRGVIPDKYRTSNKRRRK